MDVLSALKFFTDTITTKNLIILFNRSSITEILIEPQQYVDNLKHNEIFLIDCDNFDKMIWQ